MAPRICSTRTRLVFRTLSLEDVLVVSGMFWKILDLVETTIKAIRIRYRRPEGSSIRGKTTSGPAQESEEVNCDCELYFLPKLSFN